MNKDRRVNLINDNDYKNDNDDTKNSDNNKVPNETISCNPRSILNSNNLSRS